MKIYCGSGENKTYAGKKSGVAGCYRAGSAAPNTKALILLGWYISECIFLLILALLYKPNPFAIVTKDSLCTR